MSGLSTDPFLARWLWLTAGLFALSGAILVVRLGLGRGRLAGSASTEDPAGTA